MNHPGTTVEIRNGISSILTTLTISPGSASSMANVTSQSSELAILLAALHEGQTVMCRLFSIHNIMYYATKESVARGLARLQALDDARYRGEYFERKLAEINMKFIDGMLAMSIDLRYIQESNVDINARLEMLGVHHSTSSTN